VLDERSTRRTLGSPSQQRVLRDAILEGADTGSAHLGSQCVDAGDVETPVLRDEHAGGPREAVVQLGDFDFLLRPCQHRDAPLLTRPS
jgi:hypothetical protein